MAVKTNISSVINRSKALEFCYFSVFFEQISAFTQSVFPMFNHFFFIVFQVSSRSFLLCTIINKMGESNQHILHLLAGHTAAMVLKSHIRSGDLLQIDLLFRYPIYTQKIICTLCNVHPNCVI